MRRIAVVIGREPVARYSVFHGYVDAVWAAGAMPLLVPTAPLADENACAALLHDVDGLLVTGGGDVGPALYGGPDSAVVAEIDPDRDRIEAALVRAAVDEGRRVLGICRGIQLVAAALGGTLVQDLPQAGYEGHWEEERQFEPVHAIKVEPGSLAERAAAGAPEVNSIHHQAVADPGPFLRASAWSPDGVIEAVEADGVLGVQWHPERLLDYDARHLAPFKWLVDA